MNDIVNAALQAGEQEITQSMQNNPEVLAMGIQLQANAMQFLSQIPATLIEDPTYIERRINHLKRSINTEMGEHSVIDAVAEARAMVLDEADYVKYTRAKLLFQKQLNEFIGQKVVTKYVYSNARTKEVVLVEIDSGRALELDRYRGTMRYTNKAYLTQQRVEQQKKMTQEEQETEAAATGLKATYFEVLARGRRSKRELLKNANIKGALLVLWYYNKWNHMQVSSEGDINEAYANFYLNKKFNYFKQDIESNINTYMLNRSYGVMSVDNASGLLQGDVTVDNIAYAIKSRGASAFGDVDIIATATLLASMSPQDISINLINQIKESLKTNQATVRQKLNQQLSDEVNKVLEDLAKQISKNNPKIFGNW